MPHAHATTRRTPRVPSTNSNRLFLINLDTAGDRRQHMQAQLQARGLVAHRIGVDCRVKSRYQLEAMVADRFPEIRFAFELLSGAEIGCWMSHLSAWASFLASHSGDACAVIEDDVLLAPDFAQAIDALSMQATYDVIYLGTSSKNLSARRRAAINGFWVHEPIGLIFNTWGYVIRRNYLERFFATRPLRLALPIDHVLGGRVTAMRPRVAVVQPALVREELSLAANSQIEPDTRRIDRWRIVSKVRRAFLESRLSDWYYSLVRAL